MPEAADGGHEVPSSAWAKTHVSESKNQTKEIHRGCTLCCRRHGCYQRFACYIIRYAGRYTAMHSVWLGACGLRFHHHREVRPADEHVGPGWSHERTAATVRRSCYRQQTLCCWRERWTQDVQHGGVLQSHQQSVVHYAPHVDTQTWTWWVQLHFIHWYIT